MTHTALLEVIKMPHIYTNKYINKTINFYGPENSKVIHEDSRIDKYYETCNGSDEGNDDGGDGCAAGDTT